MTRLPAILIIAPNSFEFFAGTTAENQFHVITRDGGSASLGRLSHLLGPEGGSAPPVPERRRENPMAGYYLESFLRSRHYDARVVFDFDSDEQIRAGMAAAPLAVLFSTTFVTDVRLLKRSVDRLRTLIGETPLILGGPFLWKQKMEMEDLRQRNDAKSYLAAMRDFDVDPIAENLFGGAVPEGMHGSVFIGHEFGEYTLLQVLAHLARTDSSEEDLLDIPNLILPGDDGIWIMTEQRPEPVDLDRDFTRWDLVSEVPRVVPLRTSVGCPYRCKFCDFIELHPKVMMRSPESIRTEIRLALEQGAAAFDFVDDNIFLSPKRIDALTAMLIESGLNIPWGGFFRVDRVRPDNIENLVRSGCRYGLCGIESGDDRILKNMGKGAGSEELYRGLELTLAGGIYTALTFLVGFPGETTASLDTTADWANSLTLDDRAFPFYQAYPFYVLPNTAADQPAFRRRHGLRGRLANWSHATMDAREAGGSASRRLFERIRLPYNYHGNDAPIWWSVPRRNRGFAARRDLTLAFMREAEDAAIQAGFERLVRIVRETESNATEAPPAWRSVLADRDRQPGRRLPVERVGAFVPASG